MILLSFSFHSFWYGIIEFLTNTEVVLDTWVNNYGLWVYLFLFIVIFIETGVVIMPFLPGDSLLFLSGTIAHRPDNSLSVIVLLIILVIAAIVGDACNYSIGKFFGKKLFSNPNSKIFKQKYLEKTNHFYEKHGGKTIILARFVPIIRTFAPFVAGMGKMRYWRFCSFNVIGGVAWVTLFLFLGYFVGGLKFIQENIKFVCVGIIIISLLPMVYELIKNRINTVRTQKQQPKN
jgi:membrane-associated protein